MAAETLVELWRGGLLECTHQGHAVVMGPDGVVEAAWGDADLVVLPRSSCKMVQALPLVRSAAALNTEQMALACASHEGAAIHRSRVETWLRDLGASEADLHCGPQEPSDREERNRLIRADELPCQLHNNCSGKHAGFIMLNQQLGGGAEYIDPDHPVQRSVRAAFEEACGEDSPGFGIDGCSAPNFATTLTGLARAAQRFAVADEESAEGQLRTAMMLHPELVAGEGRACTTLMRAAPGKLAVKTGAEGVFVGIVPGTGHGLAVKIADGATRAAEAVIAALLVRCGVLEAGHAGARRYTDAPQLNRRRLHAATLQVVDGLRN